MTPFVEGVTHIAAIVFYLSAFAMGLVAHVHARLWARKISTIGIMAIAGGWRCFYLFLTNLNFSSVHGTVLWSRVLHYNTATWLFIMAFVIRRSERYGVDLSTSGGSDE